MSNNPLSRPSSLSSSSLRTLVSVVRTPDGDYLTNPNSHLNVNSSSVNEDAKVPDDEKLDDFVEDLEDPGDIDVYPETSEAERRWTLSVIEPPNPSQASRPQASRPQGDNPAGSQSNSQRLFMFNLPLMMLSRLADDSD